MFDNKKDAAEFYFKVFEFLMENNNITEREVYEMYGLPERDCDGCSVYNNAQVRTFANTEETDVCLVLTR